MVLAAQECSGITYEEKTAIYTRIRGEILTNAYGQFPAYLLIDWNETRRRVNPNATLSRAEKELQKLEA